MLSLPLVSPFPLGPSLSQGSLLRPGGRLSRLLRPGGRLSHLLCPGGRLSRLLRPGGHPTCQSHLTPPPTCQSHLTPHWPHMDLAVHSLPRFHLRSTALLDCAVCVKRLEAALWGGGGSVMNLVATHHNCTSPLDYISHHALHTHIPVHHYTNYTAVTIHTLVLIASPHLHLILTLTYKQHTYTHPLRSLVFPGLTF